MNLFALLNVIPHLKGEDCITWQQGRNLFQLLSCHFSPPPPETEVVIVCFSTSSCFFLFLSTASGSLTPLYAISFCLFSAASANCCLLVSGSGVTTTSSAAPPKHGKHIPILDSLLRITKGNVQFKIETRAICYLKSGVARLDL